MPKNLLSYKSSQIAYYRYGKGEKVAICFHGYGEEGSTYGFLDKYIGDIYTFYAIDLPFHGKTEWKEGLAFDCSDLQQIISLLLSRHSPNPAALSDKITLIGFSLGARAALSYYQSLPQKIEKMILMAPDGLKVNFWYWLGTRTRFGNWLFAFTMKHPGWFFFLLKLMHRLRLANTSVFKFVNYYIGNKVVRLQLYERWTSLRKLSPVLPRIQRQIRENKTPVKLIYGQYDKIILPKRGEKFREGIEDYCDLLVIPSGHQVLHEKHATAITEALLH